MPGIEFNRLTHEVPPDARETAFEQNLRRMEEIMRQERAANRISGHPTEQNLELR